MPTVAHPFAKPGVYDVKVTAVDNVGAVSAPATTKVTVRDGTAPVVVVTTPKEKARVSRFRTKRVRLKAKTKSGKARFRTTRTPLKTTFRGTATDDTAVASMQLSIKVTKLTGAKALKNGTCRYVDVTKSKIVGNPCTKPKLFRVALKGNDWAYNTKKALKLRPGSYELTALAFDTAGNPGAKVLKFTVR